MRMHEWYVWFILCYTPPLTSMATRMSKAARSNPKHFVTKVEFDYIDICNTHGRERRGYYTNHQYQERSLEHKFKTILIFCYGDGGRYSY